MVQLPNPYRMICCVPQPVTVRNRIEFQRGQHLPPIIIEVKNRCISNSSFKYSHFPLPWLRENVRVSYVGIFLTKMCVSRNPGVALSKLLLCYEGVFLSYETLSSRALLSKHRLDEPSLSKAPHPPAPRKIRPPLVVRLINGHPFEKIFP